MSIFGTQIGENWAFRRWNF